MGKYVASSDPGKHGTYKGKLTMFWVVCLVLRFSVMTKCCQCILHMYGVNHRRRLSESHNELLGYCAVLSGPVPIWEFHVYFATEARHVHPFSVRIG
jgi:hypothetical protein